MLAKISKSYQFEDNKDYEKFVSGTFEAIMKHARSLVEPDSEECKTIEFDHDPEKRISLVHWVTEPSTDPDFPDEPDHYWKYVIDIKFVADVVEECKEEVVTI